MWQGWMETREDGRRWDGRTTIEARPVRSCLPHGRRAWAKTPNGLLVADIVLQSAWGGLDRKIRRLAGGGRCEDPRASNSIHLSQSNCSVCQVLALCKPRAVPRTPATGFGRWSGAALPSLRAHKPILPGAIHRDQAGLILQNLAFAARNNPKLFPSRTLRNLFLATPKSMKSRQFTNLRMRTFIATPSARKVNSTEDPP
jgi:hypothetical protein